MFKSAFLAEDKPTQKHSARVLVFLLVVILDDPAVLPVLPVEFQDPKCILKHLLSKHLIYLNVPVSGAK